MANTEHSPLPVGALIAEIRKGLEDLPRGPWFSVEASANDAPRYWVVGDCDTWNPRIAAVPDYQGRPSAFYVAHIARCSPDNSAALLDSHAALVEALEGARAAIANGCATVSVIKQIDAALRLAKEGQPS